MDHKTTSKGFEYFIKWKGYPDSDNSWIKATDFDSINSITKYWKKLKKNKNKNSISKDKNSFTSFEVWWGVM